MFISCLNSFIKKIMILEFLFCEATDVRTNNHKGNLYVVNTVLNILNLIIVFLEK